MMNVADLEPDFYYRRSLQRRPRERRGWRAQNSSTPSYHAVATVRGAVCNHRTTIHLDLESTTSILNSDLARRLKLKLENGNRLKVKGIGGVTTYSTVTITLG